MRGIQKCHIITRKLDFLLKDVIKFNILELCPNHHWAFDHDLLTETEYNRIQGRIRHMLRILEHKVLNWRLQKSPEIDNIVDKLVSHNFKMIANNKTIKNRIFKEQECLLDENKSL